MRVLGIDPGTAIAGYGLVERRGQGFAAPEYGVITPMGGRSGDPTAVALRLQTLYREVAQLLHRHQPDLVAVEQLFFSRNVTTAIGVGQARGVILLAIAEAGLPVAEYTPMEIKMAVTGYGRADKKQVQAMVRTLLGLAEIPRPDDAADALAVALCCQHRRPFEWLAGIRTGAGSGTGAGEGSR